MQSSILTRRLQPKQIAIAQQIVVQREELQIQFRQRQAPVAAKVLARHDILVPDDLLGRVQRHLVERVQLRDATLVPGDQQLAQEALVEPMPVERRGQLLGHQIQVAGDRLQAGRVQRPEMARQMLARVHLADVGQGEELEVGELGEGGTLRYAVKSVG